MLKKSLISLVALFLLSGCSSPVLISGEEEILIREVASFESCEALTAKIISGKTPHSDEFNARVKETSHAQGFYESLEMIGLEAKKDEKKSLANLEASSFCRRFGCTKEELEMIVSRFKKKENLISVIEDVYPVFKNKKSIRSLKNYDQEISTVGVKDQCGWDSCWMNTGIEKAEAEILAEHGVSVPLSVDYSYIRYIGNEYKLGLTTEAFGEENITQNFNIFTAEWGLVPEAVLNLKNKLHDSDTADDLKEALEEIRQKFKKVSGNGSAASKSMLQEYFLEIDRLMEEFFGKLPESFVFEGETFTPQTFAQKYYSRLTSSYGFLGAKNKKNQYIEVSFADSDGSLRRPHPSMTSFNNETKDPAEILDYITDEIENGRSVAADFEWPSDRHYSLESLGGQGMKAFINQKTGEISAPKMLAPLRGLFGHAVLIIGTEYDKFGKATRLKIQNSFGKNSGDQGFYHMDINFFRHFILCAYKNNE